MPTVSNIWLINQNEFNDFIITGGKVVYIAEDIEPVFRNHPAVTSAGALLPPTEAIKAELDDEIMKAVAIYEQYLSTEADPFISVLIAAAIKSVPIALMFGRDESNLQFPKIFIDFMYKAYGIVLGIKGKVNSYIETERMPFNLAKLYSMNMIDYRTFMTLHPEFPIDKNIISRLAYDIRPVVEEKSFELYENYFNTTKEDIRKSKKFLIDPLEAI